MVTVTNSINNTVGSSNSGVTQNFTVQNLSNTANSSASSNVIVGGTSAGTAALTFSVTGQRQYALWLPATDADLPCQFVRSAVGSLTPTETIFRVDSADGGNRFWFQQSLNGVVTGGTGTYSANSAWIQIINQQAAAGSNANLRFQVSASGSGGDAWIQWTGPSNNWYQGVNKTAGSNHYQYQQEVVGSGFPGATVLVDYAPAGEITFPLTPAFLATGGTQSNVTGNGALYTVTFTASERFDQGGDFDGTSTFTAPVTGRYRFSASVGMTSVGASTTGYIQIITSNRGYRTNAQSFDPVGDSTADAVFIQAAILADMDAGDTCIVQISTTGVGANTVDVAAASGTVEQTWFCGELCC